MPTPRETILVALHARLSALPATALRGDVLPERVPAAASLVTGLATPLHFFDGNRGRVAHDGGAGVWS